MFGLQRPRDLSRARGFTGAAGSNLYLRCVRVREPYVCEHSKARRLRTRDTPESLVTFREAGAARDNAVSTFTRRKRSAKEHANVTCLKYASIV